MVSSKAAKAAVAALNRASMNGTPDQLRLAEENIWRVDMRSRPGLSTGRVFAIEIKKGRTAYYMITSVGKVNTIVEHLKVGNAWKASFFGEGKMKTSGMKRIMEAHDLYLSRLYNEEI